MRSRSRRVDRDSICGFTAVAFHKITTSYRDTGAHVRIRYQVHELSECKTRVLERIGRHCSERSGLILFNVVRDDEIHYPASKWRAIRARNGIFGILRD